VRTNYLSLSDIERRANLLIGKYERKNGSITAPVPIEKIAENILDLVIEWDVINENSDEVIFAGLNPREKKIVFNEKRKDLFIDNSGLYNTVLAHEIGHWVLHVDGEELGMQYELSLEGIEPKFIYRSTGPITSIEGQAHRFMSYLLIPYKLLKKRIETENLYEWDTLYKLREEFDVTISVLVIRLKKLGLIYIDNSKKIFPSRAVSKGQIKMI
jgi:Zn-dependent peptidase ImmA (M78 family)